MNIDPVRCILTWSVYIDLVNIEYWPGQWCILSSYFFRYNKTINNFPFGQHGKMKIPRPGTLGGLTSSTRSRVLHFTMLTSWKVINCIMAQTRCNQTVSETYKRTRKVIPIYPLNLVCREEIQVNLIYFVKFIFILYDKSRSSAPLLIRCQIHVRHMQQLTETETS